jgi:hypothetical protein
VAHRFCAIPLHLHLTTSSALNPTILNSLLAS